MRTTSTLRCLLILVGAVACSENGSPGVERGDVDGDRLVARTLSYPGGSAIQIDWYDQELDTPCEFGVAADGQLRCLPRARSARVGYPSADCEEGTLLIELYPLLDEPSANFAVRFDSQACPATQRVFRIGAEQGGPIYFIASDGVCREGGSWEELEFHLAEEVAPEEMVAADHVPVGEGRLQRYVDVARDGAQQRTSQFHDIELDDRCSFAMASDRSERCLPDRTQVSPFTPDATCVRQAVQTRPCHQSNFAWQADESTCGDTRRAYQLGDEAASELLLYYEVGGVCRLADPEQQWPDIVVRWVGAALEPSDLVGADLEMRGAGRVRDRWAVLADGTSVFRDWWDSELESTCSGLRLQDGTIVCKPERMPWVDSNSYFSDSACANATSVVVRNDCTTDVSLAVHGSYAGTLAYPEYRFHEVAGPVEGDLFILNADTSECRAVSEAERAMLRSTGAEIDYSLALGTASIALRAPR
jgi:hypothetical protein